MNLVWSMFLLLIARHGALGQSTTKFLRFKNMTAKSERVLVYIINDHSATVSLDASHPSQMLIKILDHLANRPPTFIFTCVVYPLATGHELSLSEFCWKLTLYAHGDCKAIDAFSTESFGWQKMVFKRTHYNAKEGFSVQSDWSTLFNVKRASEVEGYFYCRLTNGKGTIESNYIEIRDLHYYKYAILRSVIYKSNQMQEIKPIVKNDFPLSFHCGEGSLPYLPRWAKLERLSPYRWGICPAVLTDGSPATTTTCYTANTAPLELSDQGSAITTLGKVVTLMNGTLLFFAPESGPFPTNFALGCHSRYVPHTVMTTYCQKARRQAGSDPVIEQGITYDDSQPYTLNKIIPISELNSAYELHAGKMGFHFVLTAVYKANPSTNKNDIDFSWTKLNAENLPLEISSEIRRDRFTLQFPTSIRPIFAGVYKLTVNQFNPTRDTVVFTFNVTVLSPPRLRDASCMPALLYRMAGETATISCVYDDVATAELFINGVNISLSGVDVIQPQIRALSQTHRNLANLNVSVTPAQMNPGYLKGGNPLVYNVSDLMFSDVMNEGQSHTVTFRAVNRVGYSASSSVIQVLKTPVFTDMLMSYDCTKNCRAEDKHEFRCVLDPQLDAEYRKQGVFPVKRWFLGGMPLDEKTGGIYGDYFVFNSTDVLFLLPVNTSNKNNDRKMQKELKDNKLVCQLQILHPDYSKYANTEWQAKGFIIYDSTKDYVTAPKLVAGIRLKFVAISQASFLWVIAVVASILIVVIFIVLSVWRFTRDHGEVYLVDAKEREQGNDPIKEIKEKESFRAYERQDGDSGDAEPGEDHSKGSRFSLTEGSVVAGSDDDGELDDYGIDPKKFNEEGSFIGQYAKTPTKKSSVAVDSQV